MRWRLGTAIRDGGGVFQFLLNEQYLGWGLVLTTEHLRAFENNTRIIGLSTFRLHRHG